MTINISHNNKSKLKGSERTAVSAKKRVRKKGGKATAASRKISKSDTKSSNKQGRNIEYKRDYNLYYSPHILDLKEYVQIQEKEYQLPNRNIVDLFRHWFLRHRKNRKTVNLLPKAERIDQKLYYSSDGLTILYFLRVLIYFVYRFFRRCVFGFNIKTSKSKAVPKRGLNVKKSEYELYIEHRIRFRDLSSFFHPQLQRGWYRPLVWFIVFACILVLPIRAFTYYQDLLGTKMDIESDALSAFENFYNAKDAIENFDWQRAASEFDKAALMFLEAKDSLGDINVVTRKLSVLLSPEHSIEQTQLLLSIGSDLSKTASQMAQAWMNFTQNSQDAVFFEKKRFDQFKQDLDLIAKNINEINGKFAQIDIQSLPVAQQEMFSKMKNALPVIEESIREFDGFVSLLSAICGSDSEKRYLMMFQNNNELRPTGGFMGSFALLDVEHCKIKSLEIPGGGTYDLQGSLNVQILAPDALQLINPRWEFQDANWFFDFKTSAKKIIWFYENANGPSVDGVVAINASLLEELLKIIGPVSISGYDGVIDSENVIVALQEQAEYGYDRKENQPKKLIAELAPVVIDRLQGIGVEKYIDLFLLFQHALENKDIQFYFENADLQNMVEEMGFSGTVRDASGDYLAVVHTNIGGEKTDGVIQDRIRHTTEINRGGEVIDTVEITRTHNGQDGEKFFGVKNVDFIKIYVPLGSELVYVDGFDTIDPDLFEFVPDYLLEDKFLKEVEGDFMWEPMSHTRINQEFGKTVFANWLIVHPGETKTVTVRYRVPIFYKIGRRTGIKKQLAEFFHIGRFREPEIYSLLVQKQSGVKNQEFIKEIILPDGFDTMLQYPEDFNGILNRDRIYTAVFQ